MSVIDTLRQISKKQLENHKKLSELFADAQKRFNELNRQVIDDFWFLCDAELINLNKDVVIRSTGIETIHKITPEFVDELEKKLIEYYTEIDNITHYV